MHQILVNSAALSRRAKSKFVQSLCFGVLWLAPLAVIGQSNTNVVLAPHARDLVALEQDELVPFKSTNFFQARYTVLYFAAGWCPDCRRFSPSLVKAYGQQGSGAKRYEVLLLSRDKDAEGMLKYMRSEKMSWPAVAFDKVAGAEDLQKFFSGHGIPCLTVIDWKGSVVLQSKNDQDAAELLKQLEELVAKPSS